MGLAMWLGYTKAIRVKRICHACKTQISSSCKAKTSNKFLLDKKLDKFTGQICFLLDKSVFFTGLKILDTY